MTPGPTAAPPIAPRPADSAPPAAADATTEGQGEPAEGLASCCAAPWLAPAGPTPAFRPATSPPPGAGDGLRWEGVAHEPYKAQGTAPFRAVSRQVVFGDPALAGQLRYFEVDKGGYTTLERHAHAHGVLILRGRGRALVGTEVRTVGPQDLVFIGPWIWHQFHAADDPLGFLCLVNAERDRPQLPTEADRAALRRTPAVAAFLDAIGG